MPETKNKTLEEIDLVFSKSTRQLARENVSSTTRAASNLMRFHFADAIATFNGDERSRPRWYEARG